MKWLSWLLIGTMTCGMAGPAIAAFIGQSDAEVQTVAGPILDTVLDGLNTGNYALYSKYFDDTLKDAISQNKFSQTRDNILKNLGKYESRSYLGFLRQGQTTVLLWKGKFANTQDDILIKLVLSRRGDQVKVLGLWLQ